MLTSSKAASPGYWSNKRIPYDYSGNTRVTKLWKAHAVERMVRATMKAAANGRNGLRELNKTALTVREMDTYFIMHPSSPAAVRRPHLYLAGVTFVALLGPSVEEGIVGLGMTIEGAFRAFDFQYLKELRPPDAQLQIAEHVRLDRTSCSGFAATPGGESNYETTTRVGEERNAL